MAAHTPAERQLIIEALGGLRFVGIWIGPGTRLDELIDTGADASNEQGPRCVLNASVNNVAANSVYQRLGYRPVGDVLRYQLG